jgi:hypothetical protein
MSDETHPSSTRSTTSVSALYVADKTRVSDYEGSVDEILRQECEHFGLPVSLRALLRHIYANASATADTLEFAISVLETQLADVKRDAYAGNPVWIGYDTRDLERHSPRFEVFSSEDMARAWVSSGVPSYHRKIVEQPVQTSNVNQETDQADSATS